MIRRMCKHCGSEMIKELAPEGAVFFCKTCDGYTPYDALNMDPFCPQCGGPIEVCGKCSSGYFCNRCGCLLSRKFIVWKEKEG
jgi:formamidopyrimidine-DNA glycosylase